MIFILVRRSHLTSLNKYNEMVKTLMTYGYTAESAEEILVYASNNLWRDD
jgi:predicted Ser/Thr protein kinase